jgi:hypothetical protein
MRNTYYIILAGGNVRVRNHFVNLCPKGRVVLNWILKKYGAKV